MFVIFDLDGTLANDEHRHHFLDRPVKDWRGYYAACEADTPNRPAIWLCSELHVRHRVEIWTGRPLEYLPQTRRWLEKHGAQYDELKMRPNRDFRHPNELKGAWLKDHPWGRPILAVDDRASCVAWWRDQGIVCLDVAGHSY